MKCCHERACLCVCILTIAYLVNHTAELYTILMYVDFGRGSVLLSSVLGDVAI